MPKYDDDGLNKPPHKHVEGGWPDGTLKSGAPAVAEVARHVAIVLRDLTEPYGISRREAARRAGMSQKAILNLLNGKTWPTLITIARLEQALGIPLWGVRHHTDDGVGLEAEPREYVGRDEWPFGFVDPGAPPEVDLAQQVAKRLHNEMSRKKLTSADVAAKTGVSEGTVNAIRDGLAWPDLVTIARLERGLSIRLWISQKNA